MTVSINEVDSVEILTLQDNYIDLTARDNTEVISRGMPLKDMEFKNSITAEHGFSALLTVTKGEVSRSMLFDFGFSETGAAHNAEALGADLSRVEVCAISHGHMDHTGGMLEMMKQVGRKDLELVLHPQAFRNPRYIKITEDFKVILPAITREMVQMAGLKPVETEKPYQLLDGDLLFLGGIPRLTDYEKGMANMYYQENGEEKRDDIIDDTSIVANIKGVGLVVLSGCAHAGIVNTVNYAKETTGIDKVFAVMGGFHLTGADMGPVIEATTEALKGIDPVYVVPTHCTGRSAIMYIEREMPDSFILNMSGTRLTFAA